MLTAPRLTEDQIITLAAFAFRRQRERCAKSSRAWSAYKNIQKKTRQTIDLSDPESVSGPWPQKLRPSASAYLPINASFYDYLILSLQKGDVVSFDGLSFPLGDFIGAGNSTHIFRLLESPDRVIRLPFLASHLTDWLETPRLRVSEGLRILEETVTLARGVPRSVFLLSACDPHFRYALAEYVNGTLRADLFLERLGRVCPAIRRRDNGALSSIDIAPLGDEDREKLSDLVTACRCLLPFFPLHTAFSLAKNLLWREDSPREWKLVDTF